MVRPVVLCALLSACVSACVSNDARTSNVDAGSSVSLDASSPDRPSSGDGGGMSPGGTPLELPAAIIFPANPLNATEPFSSVLGTDGRLIALNSAWQFRKQAAEDCVLETGKFLRCAIPNPAERGAFAFLEGSLPATTSYKWIVQFDFQIGYGSGGEIVVAQVGIPGAGIAELRLRQTAAVGSIWLSTKQNASQSPFLKLSSEMHTARIRKLSCTSAELELTLDDSSPVTMNPGGNSNSPNFVTRVGLEDSGRASDGAPMLGPEAAYGRLRIEQCACAVGADMCVPK